MYKGHQFVKLTSNWVFDITEFVGYKVELDERGEIKSYTKAFIVIDNAGSYECEKMIGVPVRIVSKTLKVINEYNKKACICR